MPTLFEEVQDEDGLDSSHEESSRLILEHLAQVRAFVAAVLICWPHSHNLRGFTH